MGSAKARRGGRAKPKAAARSPQPGLASLPETVLRNIAGQLAASSSLLWDKRDLLRCTPPPPGRRRQPLAPVHPTCTSLTCAGSPLAQDGSLPGAGGQQGGHRAGAPALQGPVAAPG